MKLYPARLHLLPAKAAPIVVIIRRKPSKRFHIIKWNTKTDELEHGSWFNGKLYVNRCDVSFDGQWMVYFAMGSTGNLWNGICKLPWLKTIAEQPAHDTYVGGGIWMSRDQLCTHGWDISQSDEPVSQAKGRRIPGYLQKASPIKNVFKTKLSKPTFGFTEKHLLYERLHRDGWLRAGENWGEEERVSGTKKYLIACTGDDGWRWKPSTKHPTLRMRYEGYLEHGYTFKFWIEKYEGLLLPETQWATWDYAGNLIVAQAGKVLKYTLADIKKAAPSFELDLNNLPDLNVK